MNKILKEQLLEKVQTLCPECSVEVKEINCSDGALLLLIIKDDTEAADIDDWAINHVYPLHFKISCLLENSNAMHDTRMLFCRKNYFVLYSPEVWFSPFRGFNGLQYSSWYGKGRSSHIVAEACDIEEVIDYLLAKTERF